MSSPSSALERFAVDSEIRQLIDSTLGKHAREQSADHDFKRRGRAVVRFHYEASRIDVEPLSIPSWFEHPRNGKREAITQFTAKSRKALLRLMASLVIKEGKLPLFITLTYPRQWVAEPEAWKRHLDLFGQWIRYHHKTASIVWKLEPQERGAPHYHLMVFGVPFLPAQRVAHRWFDIVGSGDSDHRMAGTETRRVSSINGVMRYASKNYMGKECHGFGSNVGRFWGVIGRKYLPISPTAELELSEVAHARLRRVIRKWWKSKQYLKPPPNVGGLSIFSKSHLLWLRAIGWSAQLESDKLDAGNHPLQRNRFS